MNWNRKKIRSTLKQKSYETARRYGKDINSASLSVHIRKEKPCLNSPYKTPFKQEFN